MYLKIDAYFCFYDFMGAALQWEHFLETYWLQTIPFLVIVLFPHTQYFFIFCWLFGTNSASGLLWKVIGVDAAGKVWGIFQSLVNIL